MSSLVSKTCSACETGAPLVLEAEQIVLLKSIPKWKKTNSEISSLYREFKCSDYEQAVKFSNMIAELAEEEDHHPKIILEWGLVTLQWWSHKIKGLHMNDFICAAKSDEIYKSFE